MRSNRLALLLLIAGSAVLGSSAAGVASIADHPPAATAPALEQPHTDHHGRRL